MADDVKRMTISMLKAEFEHLANKWDAFQASDVEHGGSPGEWMYERMLELEGELKLRNVAIGDII